MYSSGRHGELDGAGTAVAFTAEAALTRLLERRGHPVLVVAEGPGRYLVLGGHASAMQAAYSPEPAAKDTGTRA